VSASEEVARSATPVAAQVLDRVYAKGADRLVPFADMLVVHELAHAFHDGVPFVFPRSWLTELFANMALYAFVVANEPDRSSHLETLPRVALENCLLKQAPPPGLQALGARGADAVVAAGCHRERVPG
jgi:hypothetical protein